MVKKVTPAQFRAAVNKSQRQQKQAIDKYNREARHYNAAAKKAVNDYNREVRAYNSKARAHNAKVENQRRRLQQEVRRLNSRPAATTFVTYRSSVETLTTSPSCRCCAAMTMTWRNRPRRRRIGSGAC
ncbi:hypothetical protein ACL90Y_10875 [Micrococcus luteus]